MIDTTVWTPLVYGYEQLGTTGLYVLYRDRNVYADAEGLHLRGETGVGEYVGGWIDTMGKRSWLYGYFEARMRWPNVPGIWGGFFLVNEKGYPPEIDAGEVFGDDGKLQFQVRQGTKDYNLMHTFGPSLLGQWHTFGILWEPERVALYIDDKRQWSCMQYVPDMPMSMFFNLGMGKFQVPDDGKLPATLDIEYVKVWQKK